jgi:chromosome segregation ATPase
MTAHPHDSHAAPERLPTIQQLLAEIAAVKELMFVRFDATEKALAAHLTAADKAVSAAFAASDKAIEKAEAAQKDYNQRSNEFRGQLDDQAKTLMPRSEAISLFNGIDDKLTNLRREYDSRIEGLRHDISELRESRSETTGKSEGLNAGWMILLGVIGLISSLALLVNAFRITR